MPCKAQEVTWESGFSHFSPIATSTYSPQSSVVASEGLETRLPVAPESAAESCSPDVSRSPVEDAWVVLLDEPAPETHKRGTSRHRHYISLTPGSACTNVAG